MLIPYKPWHLDLIRVQGGFAGSVHPDALSYLGPLNLAYTIVSGDENPVVLGVAGAAPMIGKEKTAEVFVVAASTRDQYPRVFARSVRQILNHSMRLFGRIEASCPIADKRKRRFLDWLGFELISGGEVGVARYSMEGAI